MRLLQLAALLVLLAVAQQAAAKKVKTTTQSPFDIILPQHCAWSKEEKFSLECNTDIPDFRSYDPLDMASVAGLAVDECNFAVLPEGNLQNLANVSHISIDCSETVVQNDAFKGLFNLTFLSLGRNVGSFPTHFVCQLKALKELRLEDNAISSDTDLGLLVNCSQLGVPFTCGRNISRLSVGNNFLTRLRQDGFLCSLSNLTELNLTHNAISEVESGAFVDNPSLRRLYLGRNAISTLPVDVFRPTVNLTFLDLSFNRLNSLPFGLFTNLTKLHFLNFKGNSIPAINPTMFFGLDDLTEVDLSDNQLTDVSYLFQPLSKLVRLDLSGNRIEKLTPAVFPGLTALNHLDLARNNLTENVDDALSGSPRLSVLILSHNHLSKVPNLSNNPLLLILRLDHNDIEDISPTDFAPSSLLLSLYLQHNKLTSLGPNIFGSFVHLLRLNLAYNDIKTVDNTTFSGLVALKFLSLEDNELTLEENVYEDENGVRHNDLFVNLFSLLVLNMSSNEIESFEYFWFPKSLLYLNLADNQIRSLPNYELGLVPALHTLDLSGNFIENLTQSLFPPSLKHLILNSNKIRHVEPDAFEDLKNLETLNLRSNFLVTLAELKLATPLTSLFLKDNPWLCDCKLSWLKSWKGVLPMYDAMSMKCQTLFNPEPTPDDDDLDAPEAGPQPFLSTDLGKFLCAFKKNPLAGIYGQSLLKMDVTKSVYKCTGYRCAQEQKCPDGCYCYHNWAWTVVKVVCKKLALTQVPSEAPESTDVVYLEENPIVEINVSTFKNYGHGLKHLYIRKSKLKHIGHKAFDFTKNIERIVLDHNSVETLPPNVFDGLKKVKHIDLSFNVLKALPPDTFDGLAALETLNLQNNMLSNFPVWNLKNLPAMSSVGLSNNPWTCDCTFMFPYTDYLKAKADIVKNVTQLYCKPVAEEEEEAVEGPPENSTIPLAIFNMTRCFQTRFMAEQPAEQAPGLNSHAAIVVVSIMVTVVFVVLGVVAFVYRQELRFALEKKFGERLIM